MMNLKILEVYEIKKNKNNIFIKLNINKIMV